MNQKYKTWLIMGGTAIGLLILLDTCARAHSWYDWDCCDKDDCRLAEPHEIKTHPQGYVAHGQWLKFDSGRVRKSKDGEFHICLTPVHPDDPSLKDTNKEAHVRCIYEPRKVEAM